MAKGSTTYRLENLDCAMCAANLEGELRKCEFVRSVSIDFGTLSLKIDTDDMAAVEARIADAEPNVRVLSAAGTASRECSAEEDGPMIRFGSYSLPRRRVSIFAAAAVLWGAGIAVGAIGLSGWWNFLPLLPFAAGYLLAGAPVLKDAARNILKGRALDENFLMSIATLGAFAVGEWEEAVGVMIFYMIGELVQEAAVLRSRRSIDALLALKPDKARMGAHDSWLEVRPEEVPLDSLVLVRPGERIPLDGVVVSGGAFVDSSLLSGESVPRRVEPGDEVRSGTIAADGVLEIRTTRLAGDSSAARIVELVENASHAKARTERFSTAFARWYTPAVVLGAVLVAAAPPLLIPGESFGVWLYRALIMLVISCPCALVVSVPLGYFGGIGGLSRRGILVKGASFLDSLAKARRVAFDKTGTLTEGVFTVNRVVPADGVSEDEVLRLAASAEVHSNHPLAVAIRARAADLRLEATEPDSFKESAGYGVEASVGGRSVLAGNRRFLAERGVAVPPRGAEDGAGDGTAVLVAVDGAYFGAVLVGDRLKEGSAEAVSRLRGLGIGKISLVSGDAAGPARAAAERLGISEVHAELLPEDKLALIEGYAAESASEGPTIFVGDGINDSPVLARSDVGIAMGSGADAAVEAADVIVMTDDPRRVPEAIERARRTRRIVAQNVVFALGFKAVFLVLGAFGIATMWEAVIADVGVALAAVLNSTRALK
jgi:Cd2+/Zn2+-exporting ATPase